MKEMRKARIIAKKSVHSVLNERELLATLKHPFLVNISFAFQDRERLFLVMDLLPGGDLRYHMGMRRFAEEEARFLIGCILIGLEFLHLHGIIHRDVKPENLVFEASGYLRITDLGIARVVKPSNSGDTSGTPGYMAPEVMCRQNHSYPADYYAVGVIAYELMLGRRPYQGHSRNEIREQILSKQVLVRPAQVPEGWSSEAADFINRLLQRKVSCRLGSEQGMAELKEHGWLRGTRWAQLLRKQLPAPFVPREVIGSSAYRGQISSGSSEEGLGEQQLLCRQPDVEQLFEGYRYCEERQCESKERKASHVATTTNTHYSFADEKESAAKKRSK